MTRESWLIYACGGGYGHVNRACALVAQAQRRGISCELIISSGDALAMVRGLCPVHLVPAGTTATALQHMVSDRANAASCLLVDTFPRGILGELAALLPRLTLKKVLVRRAICDEYDHLPAVQAAGKLYDLQLLPGEGRALPGSPAQQTAAWLRYDRSELLPSAAARRRLAAEDRQALVVVSRCGLPTERRRQATLAAWLAARCGDRVQVRCIGPEDGLPPLLQLLPGIDLLVAAGGYNSVHECRATRTPLLGRAQPRRYDRQGHRLRAKERWQSLPQLLAYVRVQGRRFALPRYRNGAAQACDVISRLG